MELLANLAEVVTSSSVARKSNHRLSLIGLTGSTCWGRFPLWSWRPQWYRAFVLVVTVLASPATLAADAEMMARGKYMFNSAGCLGCHTDSKNKGPLLAGGHELKTPFGNFYTPNITPDRETGIGAWTDADFVNALRHGKGPRGQAFYPAFPYPSYTGLTDRDMLDIKAYIFSLPAVRKANRPHDLSFPFNLEFLNHIWQMLFLETGPRTVRAGMDPKVARGAYLVEAATHCGECHTPRNLLGATRGDKTLAGAVLGPEENAPNITPDNETGIGKWSIDEIKDSLDSGMIPDGDFLGDSMAEVVENSTSKLTDADREAIALYLKSLPPIANKIK
jgi:mono/diheme cytochrome c family protein